MNSTQDQFHQSISLNVFISDMNIFQSAVISKRNLGGSSKLSDINSNTALVCDLFNHLYLYFNVIFGSTVDSITHFGHTKYATSNGLLKNFLSE